MHDQYPGAYFETLQDIIWRFSRCPICSITHKHHVIPWGTHTVILKEIQEMYILTHLNIILKVFKISSLRRKMYSIYFDQIYLCE